jgi:DNA end-binding protein Ku
MALKLVDQLTQPFIPEDFHDTYTEQLEAVIEAKLKGQKPKAQKAPTSAPSADLMAVLKASLEQSKAKG